MKDQKSHRDIAVAFFFAGLFVLIVAVLTLEKTVEKTMDDNDDSKVAGRSYSDDPNEQQGREGTRPIDLVNKHLREVYDREEIQRRKVEILNRATAPPLHRTKPNETVLYFNELPLSFDQDSLEELVGQDLRLFSTSASRTKGLNQQIQDEIIEEMARGVVEEKERKALADSIIAKAREKGFDIKIDEDFKIQSVRKIVVKDHPSVFDPNSLPHR